MSDDITNMFGPGITTPAPLDDVLNQVDEFNGDESSQEGIETLPQEPKTPQEAIKAIPEDEPLFLNGPSRKDVEELKTKYPNSKLYMTLFADGSGVIWRTMTRLDWRNLQGMVRQIPDDEKRQEIVFSKVAVAPAFLNQQMIDALPAGSINAVMQEFYLYSGFQPIAESLEL